MHSNLVHFISQVKICKSHYEEDSLPRFIDNLELYLTWCMFEHTQIKFYQIFTQLFLLGFKYTHILRYPFSKTKLLPLPEGSFQFHIPAQQWFVHTIMPFLSCQILGLFVSRHDANRMISRSTVCKMMMHWRKEPFYNTSTQCHFFRFSLLFLLPPQQ